MSDNKHNTSSRFIYFSGVDGCGKSTVIDELIKTYEKKGIKARRVWLRFNYLFTRPVLLYCRITGLTRRQMKAGKVYSIHDFHKSKIIAVLVQYLHLIDTALAYIMKVWIPLKTSHDVILCDKFIYDILVDFMVETKDPDLLHKNITKLFMKLMPKDIPIIFLSADREEIIKRKPSVLIDDEDYNFKYEAYNLIADTFHANKVANDRLKETVDKVSRILHI